MIRPPWWQPIALLLAVLVVGTGCRGAVVGDEVEAGDDQPTAVSSAAVAPATPAVSSVVAAMAPATPMARTLVNMWGTPFGVVRAHCPN